MSVLSYESLPESQCNISLNLSHPLIIYVNSDFLLWLLKIPVECRKLEVLSLSFISQNYHFKFCLFSLFFCRKMSKISYSYSALRQLSSDGFTPMVSGGFNVHAPGHIVLQKSINVPKQSDSDPKQEKERKLSWGTLREPGTIRQRFYETQNKKQ